MSNVHDVMPAAKTILAVDLGKFKSVACVLDVASGAHRFETIPTNPAAVHDLLAAAAPCRLVIEACSVAGWVHDLAVALSIPVQVANTNGEAWHYKLVQVAWGMQRHEGRDRASTAGRLLREFSGRVRPESHGSAPEPPPRKRHAACGGRMTRNLGVFGLDEEAFIVAGYVTRPVSRATQTRRPTSEAWMGRVRSDN